MILALILAALTCHTDPNGNRICAPRGSLQICTNRCAAQGTPTAACIQRCIERGR